MSGICVLFIYGYLLSSLFLFPLTLLYISLGIRKRSIATILQFHKVIVLLSIILPLGMLLLSYGKSITTEKMVEATPMQLISSAPHATGEDADDLNVPEKVLSPGQSLAVLEDLLFYLVDIIGLFSLTGVAIFTLRYVFQVWLLGRVSRDSIVSVIDQKISLFESLRVRSPFSVGIFWKSIFIPADMAPKEREIVIRHESNHFRCHHHAWSLFESLLVCLFWFNPIAHFLRKRGILLRELECDIRTVSVIDRFEYTRLLLKTAESMDCGGRNSHFSLLTQGWIRKEDLQMRIEKLMDGDTVKERTALGIFIVTAVASTIGLALIFGNQNDTARQEILIGIDKEYTNRVPVTERIDLRSVPVHFITALLVYEDASFFEHKGIRVRSMIRAAGVNLKTALLRKAKLQGGSTITQQLAKQFIDNPKRTMGRKLKELKVGRVIEMNFTKKEILEMYLNMVYFGNGAFGLKAASNTYFGHGYQTLSTEESAMLVPFLDAPAKVNMIDAPVTAKKRQAALLKRMNTSEI